MSLHEILLKVDSFPAQHCVLTGGEPMVADGIHALATALKERGKHITIETAATIPPKGIASTSVAQCQTQQLRPTSGCLPFGGENTINCAGNPSSFSNGSNITLTS